MTHPAAVGLALLLALSGCGESSRTTTSTYTLMQMNLCLSGLAGCYGKVAYPAVLDEAVTRIRAGHPDAVTFNEACRRDVMRIARRTGYHARFSRVIYRGEPLRCVRPGARGLFGIAVLTRASAERAESHDFDAQAGLERRRWLCVTADVDVCTAHLNRRTSDEIVGNDAQCAELAGLLARRATGAPRSSEATSIAATPVHPTASGPAPTRPPARPPGSSTCTGAATSDRPPRIEPAEHTDHDILFVGAQLTR